MAEGKPTAEVNPITCGRPGGVGRGLLKVSNLYPVNTFNMYFLYNDPLTVSFCMLQSL